MKIFLITFLTILSFFTIGCSSGHYGITYNTNPIGANLVCGGQSKGYTPVTLYYTFENDNYNTVECEAIWISGARATFQNYWGDVVEEYPQGVRSTLQRPDYPDLDKDMQFAFQVQQMKQQEEMQRQQMAMQQRQMLSQQLDELNRSIWEQNRMQQENFDRSLEYWRQQDQENYQNQMLYQMQNLNRNLNNLNHSLY
ncbi:hypothetical protein [Helicobacter sp. UBA3407]|nr:hypothetical protein [Helicobacter sp. UBA3407]